MSKPYEVFVVCYCGVIGVQAFHRGLGGVPEQEGGQEGGGTAQQHPG